MDVLSATHWSPYAVGVGIGVLSWLSFLILRQPLSCSTSFARTAGMLERCLFGAKATEKPFYRETRPVVDWQWMLVLGIVFGSLLSARLSGNFRLQWVPDLWAAAYGPGVVGRLLVACAGGVLLGFGARWANGCTSGHGISGTMQLAVSSWVAAVCFFAGGVLVAHLVY